MIKTVRTVLTGAVLVTGVAVAGQPDFSKDGEMNVCTTANFPPMTYKSDPADPKPIGIDIDIIEAIGELWKVKISYTITEFSGMLPTLGSGRCDLIISGIYVTDKRREAYDAARYMKSATVIVTGADNAEVKEPADLSGKVLALEAGSYYGEERVVPLNTKLAEAGIPTITVQEYPSQLGAYQQVLGGRADATMTEEAEGAFRVATMSDRLRIAYTWESEFTYGIYVQRNPGNIEGVKEALLALRNNGLFNDLAEKYGVNPAVFDVDYDS